MESVFNTLSRSLIQLVSPGSLAFIEEGHSRFSVEEFRDSEALKAEIQPGDIVITKTPSTIYKLIRKIMHADYDHVAVFLNKKQALHISPPRIRIVSSNIFLMKKLHPIILRPKLNEKELADFLERL
jgi:hypothetical protein